MGKIYAITSSGKTEKSFLDLRFGKCEYLVLFYSAKNKFTIVENKFLNESHSGTKLVDFLTEQDVTTIITGEVGPLVSSYLEEKRLQLVLLHEERIRIEDIIKRIKG